MPNLSGKICLVTGASRGIGRGIALQLLTDGATCYITGRNEKTLKLVGEEVKNRGGTGTCIPVVCNHQSDDDIRALFQKIEKEQGQLDLLVNNAYSAVAFIFEHANTNFWEQPDDGWDIINNVGLRNNYICAVHAARMMVKKRKGLIVNISSPGGAVYFQTAAYGVGKCGKDRMAKDCGYELEKYNVAFISLWPGPVKTEMIQERVSKLSKTNQTLFEHGESIEFAGKAISNLLNDDEVIKRSSQILLTNDLAEEFHFTDVDGSKPTNMRSFSWMFLMAGYPSLASWCPSWMKIPFWLMTMMLSITKPRLNKNKLKSE